MILDFAMSREILTFFVLLQVGADDVYASAKASGHEFHTD